MVSWFSILFSFVVLQRLIELFIAKRNARYILSVGGLEVGREHYPFIVLTHVCFFATLLVEVSLRDLSSEALNSVPLTLFFAAQVLRVWCLAILGRFWNTRIFVVPGSKPVTRGPYQYLRHPNYVVVVIEIAMLPLVFGAYGTAILFSLVNLAILRIRIRVEENALCEWTNYGQEMERRFRFFPIRRS